MDLAKDEKCEFIPFMCPKEVVRRGDKVSAMKFCKYDETDEGSWAEDPDQVLTLKADYIISAFGSGLTDTDGKL